MTYRTDSAQSPPQKGSTMKGKAPAAPAAPAPAPMGATQIATNPQVAHQQHLSQTNNLPLVGGYMPAHPQQLGKV